MPSIEAEIDAHFYELIHKLLSFNPDGERPGDLSHPRRGTDRRAHAREAFASVHKIASYDGVTLPEPEDFAEIHCRDLARGGFSYLAQVSPNSTNLIVAFGVPPDVTCVEARVICETDVIQFPSSGVLERIDDVYGPVQYQGPNGESGVPRVLIGCEFVRRLEEADGIPWT